MKYYIYTDECGSWSRGDDKEHYYVRCWLRIPRHKIRSFSIHSIDDHTKLLYVFVRLKDFYTQKIRVRDKINEVIENTFARLREKGIPKDYMNVMPSYIKNSINKVLFLNIYEKWMWKTAVEFGLFENVDHIYIHKPQFTEREYRGLIGTMDFSKNIYSFVSGNSSYGIRIVDSLSRLLHRNLEKGFAQKERVALLKNVLSRAKNIPGNMHTCVDKIFFNKNLQEDKELRQLFSENLNN